MFVSYPFIFIFFYTCAALMEQQNEEVGDKGLDNATVAGLIITGIGALIIFTFMACVGVVYWSPKYAKFIEKRLQITNC